MHAKKSLGQNFLVGSHYPEQIVSAVAPSKDDTIIEIGPGHGAMTGLLLDTGANVIALELDKDLIPLLTQRYSSYTNFRLVKADALKANICELIQPSPTARIVANLPYYISTAIIQHLIQHRRCLSDITVMLQTEVVDRITATPGCKEYGFLTMLVQFYCKTQRLFDVPPVAFRPIPKVNSTVVRLQVREKPVSDVADESLFVEMIKVLFSQRRKTMMNNLRSGYNRLNLTPCSLGSYDADVLNLVFKESEVDSMRRAETLTLQEAARLANSINRVKR